MDVAASIQAVLDEAVLRLTRSLARQTGSTQPVPRRRRGAQLRRQRQGAARRPFRQHLDPAGGGDAGGAVGAALAAYHIFKGQPRKTNRRATAWPAPISARASRKPRSNGG